MNPLAALFAPGSWPAFVLISTRLAGLMVVAPFWSMLSLPRSARGAIVVVLAAMLVPASPKPAFPDKILAIPLPLMTELVIGLGLGLGAAVIVQAMTLASEVVALQTGLSLGQVLTPNLETGGPAITQLYGLLGLAAFVALGGPLLLLDGLAGSLQAIPPGGGATLGAVGPTVLRLTGAVFAHAVQIAAPVMVALTVTNVAMAILSRAVPQLNAMAMSFAVTLGVGLLTFGLSLPLLVRVTSRWVAAIPASIDAIVGALAAAPVAGR